MKPIRSRVHGATYWSLVALLIVVSLVSGCAPSTLTPEPVSAVPQPVSTVPQPKAPTLVAPEGTADVASHDLPVGVDAEGNFYRGNLDAPVNLVEFSDFECPFCARHAVQTGPLLDEAFVSTGQVLHYFRFFPIPELGHVNAIAAAQATYCAGQQEPKYFWGMHDWLFTNQGQWAGKPDAAADFRQQAISMGVDGTAYDSCLGSQGVTDAIARDMSEARAVGVSGTPAFLVNDWFVSGAQPFSEFQKAIEKATQGIHPPPTPTPLPQGANFFDPDPLRPGLTYDGSPTTGESTAPVVIVAFEDFKSSASAQHVAVVEPSLQTKYIATGQLRWVVALFPVSAPKAAVAAICASRQDRFWEYRTALYAKQAEWAVGDDAALRKIADELSLDGTAFQGCMDDPQAQAQVDTALDFAQSSIGVPSAPSYLILKMGASGQVEDGRGYPGEMSLQDFEKAIDDLLAPPAPQAPQAPTQTPPAPTSKANLSQSSVGVDSQGNFYRGDPSASVRLVEFSDFQ